ncbi:MAG: hypothetical protein JRC92_11485 [Deltaproteobacteria bacterium]|nr:hypothetical protein [Deltaproteobacteria bacterium]
MRPLKDWISTLFAETPTPERVLFRVDAGRVEGLSYGHVSRCLALAKTARAVWGSRSLFLMRDHPEGVDYVVQAGWEVKTIPALQPIWDEDEPVLSTAESFQPDWLVIDLPYPDLKTAWLKPLRRAGKRVLFIDDARFTCPEVDVYLNSSLLAPNRTRVEPGRQTRRLLGPDYFIFDDSLLAEPLVKSNGLINVVITCGGSDPTGLTLKMLQRLVRQDWNGVTFRVILGPGFGSNEQAARLTGKRAGGFELIHSPPNLIPYLRGADLTVCTGGRTMSELLYLGQRFLPISTADHESEAIEALLTAGLIKTGLTRWQADDFIVYLLELINEIGMGGRASAAAQA